jgi:PP-loop superfamily ATP-utilizing enzyme
MQSVSENLSEKRLGELERIVAPYESALVAFSGGVDSSLALAVAARALPKERVLAVTSNNETYLPSELEGAEALARSLGVEHLVVNTRELDDPNYASNPTNRCYFCKSTLYSDLARLALEKGYACVVDGANKDDEAAELGQAGACVSFKPVPLWAGDHAGEARPGRSGRGVPALAGLRASAGEASW